MSPILFKGSSCRQPSLPPARIFPGGPSPAGGDALERGVRKKHCCFVGENSTEFRTPGRASRSANERRSTKKNAESTRGRGGLGPAGSSRTVRVQQDQGTAGNQEGQRILQGDAIPGRSRQLPGGPASRSRREETRKVHRRNLHGHVPAGLQAPQGPGVRQQRHQAPPE